MVKAEDIRLRFRNRMNKLLLVITNCELSLGASNRPTLPLVVAHLRYSPVITSPNNTGYRTFQCV